MVTVLSSLAWPASQTLLTFGKDFTNGLDYAWAGYNAGNRPGQSLAHPFFELDNEQGSIRKPFLSGEKN